MFIKFFEGNTPAKISMKLSSLMIILSLAIVPLINAENKVTLYLFYGRGCPHCAKELAFLQQSEGTYPELELKVYEIYYNSENAKLFAQMSEAFGKQPSGVPTTFIDDKVIIGFGSDSTTGKLIEEKIQYCIEQGCIDPIEKLDKPSETEEISESIETTTVLIPEPSEKLGDNITIKQENTTIERKEDNETLVNLPVLGNVDTTNVSIPALTIILGALDSFNPCAFFVLFFLLSMLIYAQSRKRMLLIGGTFVSFSGIIYFLFMAAWLNLFLILGQLKIITIAAGLVALVVAFVNIKDFFFFKRGVSLAISESAKPKLFERMRGLLKATSLPSMMLGTVVLAITANTYELLCTAGFPMVFTRVLTLHGLSSIQYYFYLALYNLVYIIPLMIIVSAFTITLGARKLTESQGQILKLISGMMMLCLGLILLINPALLNNVFIAIGLLALALTVSTIIVTLKKVLRNRVERGELDENQRV